MSNRIARFASWASILLAASSLVPLPLPSQGIAHALDRALGLEAGRCQVEKVRFRWSTGTLILRDITVESEGRGRARVPRLSLSVELNPLSGRFLQPRDLRVDGPNLVLDREFLSAFGKQDPQGGQEEGTPPTVSTLPLLPLSVDGGTIVWAGEGLRTPVALKIDRLRGGIGPEGVRLTGVLRLPWGGTAACGFLASPSGAIEGRCRLDCYPLDASSTLSAGVTARAASLRGAVRATYESGELDIETDLRIDRLFAAIDGLDLQIDGDLVVRGRLSDGIAIRGRTSAEEMAFSIDGLARMLEGSPRVDLDLVGPKVPLDAPLARRLIQFVPSLGPVFDAIQPSGSAELSASASWVVGLPPTAALLIEPSDFSLTFAGFTENDGGRTAFPYPFSGVGGALALMPGRLLLDMQGAAGEGELAGLGAITIGNHLAGIDLDLEVEGVAFDATLREAATALPGVGNLLDELGVSEGGSVGAAVRIYRPSGELPVNILAAGSVSGASAQPSFLPISATTDRVDFRWRPRRAEFAASGRALGGVFSLDGESRITDEGALLDMRASLPEASPEQLDRAVLCSTLGLPEELQACEFGGPLGVTLFVHHEADSPLRWLATAEPTEVVLNLTGSGLRLEHTDASLCVADIDGQIRLACPAGEALIDGQRVRGNVVLDLTGEPSGFARGHLRHCEMVPTVERLLAPEAGLEPIFSRFEVKGIFDADATIDIGTLDLSADVDLDGLVLRLKIDPERWLRLKGGLRLADGRVTAPVLHTTIEGGELDMTAVQIERIEEATRMRTKLEADAIEVDERLAALLGEQPWAAFERLGVAGQFGLDGVELDLLFRGEDGAPIVGGRGTISFADAGLVGPPLIENGAGSATIRTLLWQGPDDYALTLELQGASASISGVPISEGEALLTINPTAAVMTGFRAEVLKGHLQTPLVVQSEDGERPGRVRLELTSEASLSGELQAKALDLAAFRRELGTGGALSGRMNGDLTFTSRTPSPLDYRGTGSVEIRNGYLGTVPVLSELFQVVGLENASFSRASVDFELKRAGGYIEIPRAELAHDVVALTAEGWIRMDGQLHLKAIPHVEALPTIPLVSSLFDAVNLRIMGVDVVGWIDQPVVRHRTLAKLTSGGDEVVYPHPMWLTLPNWPSLDRVDGKPWNRNQD